MKSREKMMSDLQRLLAAQEFESEADVQKFLSGLIGNKIPQGSSPLGPKEQAQDLVFEAYELSKTKGKQKIELALELDPDCIEAYEYLAGVENSPAVALSFFEKGIHIGRRIYGGQFRTEHKGHFWGIYETRPFMRCLSGSAEILYAMGNVAAAAKTLEEMIELNPNDNQGVREILMIYLIELGEDSKFEFYEAMYRGALGAFSAFTRALYAFKSEGASTRANSKLRKAINVNPLVPVQLVLRKPIRDLPDSYSQGSPEEAKIYASFARYAWRKTDGAVAWLQLHAASREQPRLE
jgi:tetratricopeptide (TPR) repeat protein